MRLKTAVLLGLVLAVGVAVFVLRDRTPLRGEYCVAEVGDTRARVDLEQARWAALMSSIGQSRGLPPRATTIAIATAFQESKIRNIDYGDRDSVGLFQQRPSQGWGTIEQIMDPGYSIGAFYDGLQEIDGYDSMEITDAAQAVQRSAYPEAYADHEPYARALASSLTGHSPAAFTCQLNPTSGGSTDGVTDDVATAFGDVDVDVQVDERTVRVDVEDTTLGWSVAHYLVANAQRLRLADVQFDGRRWNAEKSPDGWQSDDSGATTVVARLT